MAAFTLEELKSMTVVNIADYKLGRGDKKFITRDLGSCVGIAILDPITMVGGLIHIMLPQYIATHFEKTPNLAKYADAGLDEMIKELVYKGAKKDRLVAKLAGAAHMVKLNNVSKDMDISSRNLEAVQNKLEELHIPIVASEVGEDYPRTVVFDLETGSMRVMTAGKSDRIL